MLNTQFSPWPVFEADERDAAMGPLFSGKVNYWTGQDGREFEKEYAAYTGRSHAIALANGSLAIELALCALNIGPGDEVITTARTFIASASSVVMRGAVPVIADVDSVSQDITAEIIRAVLTPRTKVIICVHLAGWPCDMDSIMELAAEKNLYVIEDCAQAHGARYKGKPVGSFGHMAAFSFCQDKIMTTGGEGGMLVMDDEKLWKKAWAFKDHGKSWDAVYERDHTPGFRWLHESFGTNWRMTEMQAAIGRVQLRKLDDWVATRRAHAAKLTECFENLPGLRVTLPGDEIFHSYYKYYAFVRPEMLKDGWSRDRIMNEVMGMGVPCFSGSCSEIYREKAFTDAGYGPAGRLPVAKELGETSLMFLVHPTLKDEEIAKTCEVVEKVMGRAGV
ncbi:DegT/DnrJ/EryC1/StrS family aminotransferase [Desulfogranum mediterraneum]|uniref:DegT/DnrJ/EryC1/StrS family aminotransferase n=1 Tax=Desulfogranum mediterraneum TaxID=160661 RepID=UPI00040774DF|nr:DegT/DnrJ/EryC1/StrS aminotransferase family protein [Desulfogranum mediterraneum]